MISPTNSRAQVFSLHSEMKWMGLQGQADTEAQWTAAVLS